MNLKSNIFVGYISQLYVAAISVAMVPLYLKYMGAESYGLVGFFSMLQMWFGLLDMGLSPTIAREAARFRGGALDALSYRRLVRVMELLFFLVALLGFLYLTSIVQYISQDWLNPVRIPQIEVEESLQLMAITVVFRWMSGLYRGIISGSERLVWLGTCNGLIASLRFVFVIPVLILIPNNVVAFFAYQCCVAVIELVALVFYSYKLIPKFTGGYKFLVRESLLGARIKFATSIAFTSSVWIFVTQTDKLILSKILSLSDYGYFTLGVLVASSVTLIGGPICNAILPRMTNMEAAGDPAKVIDLYRRSTQWVMLSAGTVAIFLAIFAEEVLYVWTGNYELSIQVGPILRLYSIGNGILAAAAFPYYLQYAKGDLRLHLIGNALFVTILVPSIMWAARDYGAIGAGYMWVAINALSFVAWIPLVHNKFVKNLNFTWYSTDILRITLPMIIAGCFVNAALVHESYNRILLFICLGFSMLLIFSMGLMCSTEFIKYLKVKTRFFQ
jgi:O-antigen/teichoic acid export membrane protein